MGTTTTTLYTPNTTIYVSPMHEHKLFAGGDWWWGEGGIGMTVTRGDGDGGAHVYSGGTSK